MLTAARRLVQTLDGAYPLYATNPDGSTKSSTAHNPQGSIPPAAISGGGSLFSWQSGGPATGQMWLSLTWSAVTAYRPDGSTVAIPGPPAAPPAPTLSQVAGGALAARTRWVRVAYAKSLGGIMTLWPVSAESSLAISVNNLLHIASPPPMAGFTQYVVLVGSAANTEFTQSANPNGFNHTDLINIGTDWQESTTGFATNNTPYDSVNWKSVTMIDQTINTTFWLYPYYDLVSGYVFLSPAVTSGPSAQTAALQIADGHIPMSAFSAAFASYGFSMTTPAGGGSQSGSGGGGRFT